MWSHNRNNCCRTRLQPDPPCDAVPGPPSLSQIILPCPSRHISFFPTCPGTLFATAAISIQNSSTPDTPIHPLYAAVSKPTPSLNPPPVLFRNFAISLRALLKQPSTSHWLMKIDDCHNELGT